MQSVLLVDDEPNIRKALVRILHNEPWQVLTAKSGREALEVLAGTRVDVVVSDVRMPGMSGVELLGAVSRLYPATVRIILTGHDDAAMVFQAISDGAIYRFLTKPWNNEELVAVLREAMAKGQKEQEGGTGV